MDEPTVTSKGQVTIPKEIRRELGIRQGSKVRFSVRNGKAEMRVVHRAPEKIESGFGMLSGSAEHVPPDFDVASLLRRKERGRR